MRTVKKEPMVIDLEEVLRGDHMIDTEKITESNQSNMQNKQSLYGNNVDPCFMMLLDSFRAKEGDDDDDDSYLRDNPLRAIRYEEDNGSYENRQFKPNNSNIKTTKPHVVVGLNRRKRLVTDTRNSQDHGEKAGLDIAAVLDESYKSYLIWLVENSKSSRTKVKCEEDDMSLSDSDSDIIAVQDCPFMDEEDSPFVPSKNYEVIDLEEGSECDKPNSWFKKEIMSILKEPFDENKYKELYDEASEKRLVTKCRELRDGRVLSYQTDQKGPSYLDMYPKFRRMVNEARREGDHHKALNLLRGFRFYLTKVARDDAFKPWRNRECLNIRCS